MGREGYIRLGWGRLGRRRQEAAWESAKHALKPCLGGMDLRGAKGRQGHNGGMVAGMLQVSPCPTSTHPPTSINHIPTCAGMESRQGRQAGTQAQPPPEPQPQAAGNLSPQAITTISGVAEQAEEGQGTRAQGMEGMGEEGRQAGG